MIVWNCVSVNELIIHILSTPITITVEMLISPPPIFLLRIKYLIQLSLSC